MFSVTDYVFILSHIWKSILRRRLYFFILSVLYLWKSILCRRLCFYFKSQVSYGKVFCVRDYVFFYFKCIRYIYGKVFCVTDYMFNVISILWKSILRHRLYVFMLCLLWKCDSLNTFRIVDIK